MLCASNCFARTGCDKRRVWSRILSKYLERNTNMLHNGSIFSRCGRTERELGKSLDSSTFLDLILTQGRKFEDIKTNVTRHVLGTEPRRKCQELPQYNEGKIDRNFIIFQTPELKGQTFEFQQKQYMNKLQLYL